MATEKVKHIARLLRFRIARVSLADTLREGGSFARAHPYLTIFLALAVMVLTGADLMEVIPLFAPVAASPFFPFFHEAHDLLAIGVVLYVAYRWLPALGMGAFLLYLALHVPYFFLRFPEDQPEMFRILVVGLVGFLGLVVIALLRRTGELLQNREREITGLAQQQQKVIDEWIVQGENLTRRTEQLEALVSLAGHFSYPLSVQEVLEEAVEKSMACLRVDCVWVHTLKGEELV